MVVLSNTNQQTIQVGQQLTFPVTLFKSCKNDCCGGIRNTSVKMCHKGPHRIAFHANLGTDTEARQLVIAVDGVQLPETTMITVPATAGQFENVSAETIVRNCCGCVSVTVVNNGTTPVIVGANPALIIEEVSN